MTPSVPIFTKSAWIGETQQYAIRANMTTPGDISTLKFTYFEGGNVAKNNLGRPTLSLEELVSCHPETKDTLQGELDHALKTLEISAHARLSFINRLNTAVSEIS
jgi:hypothetical protein